MHWYCCCRGCHSSPLAARVRAQFAIVKPAMQNENGKRPLEHHQLLVGLAKEADVIAERAEAIALRNQDLATEIVKAAKETNALAREARSNAMQAWAKANKAAPEGVKIDE